uniref:Uncharacterized protein n=1 Tax=Arundo donax TaxID=35708 RepID=A0A0A9AP85_ARUDO
MWDIEYTMLCMWNCKPAENFNLSSKRQELRCSIKLSEFKLDPAQKS